MTARERRLLSIYGITEVQYEELLKKQDFRCAICRREASVFNKRLAVEHSHKTKMIRGLACTYCNRYLIGRHNDPVLLRHIADYISQDTGWKVPDKKKKKRKRRVHRSRISKK